MSLHCDSWVWFPPWAFSYLEAELPEDILHYPASSQHLLGSGTLTWLELKSFNVTLLKNIYVYFWRLPSPCAWGIHVQTPKDWFTTSCQMSYFQKCQKPTRTENTRQNFKRKSFFPFFPDRGMRVAMGMGCK